MIQHVTMWSDVATCDAITRLIGRNTRDAIRTRMERFQRGRMAGTDYTWIHGQTLAHADWIEYVPEPQS